MIQIMRAKRQLAAMFLLAALLAGCYQSDVQVIVDADRAPLPPAAVCQGKDDKKPFTLQLAELKTSAGAHLGYRMTVAEEPSGKPSDFRLKRAASNLYLLQVRRTSESGVAYDFYYLRFGPGAGRFQVLSPKLVHSRTTVGETYGVIVEGQYGDDFVGDRGNIERLLLDPNAHELSEVFGCTEKATPVAAAGRRVALVIGNQSYRHLDLLNNPAHDAGAVAALLRKNGFAVVERQDADFLALHDAVADFKRLAASSDLALVFYAGHGMEVDGKDVLAPIDMTDACDGTGAKRAIALNDVFEAVESARAKIVLVDACRNNPFPRCPAKSAGGAGGFRGFARVSGAGLLIASSTLPGSVAADGLAGQGSPFANALVARLQENPRLEFRDVLSLVAEDVDRITGGRQIPEVTQRGAPPRACLAGVGCVR